MVRANQAVRCDNDAEIETAFMRIETTRFIASSLSTGIISYEPFFPSTHSSFQSNFQPRQSSTSSPYPPLDKSAPTWHVDGTAGEPTPSCKADFHAISRPTALDFPRSRVLAFSDLNIVAYFCWVIIFSPSPKPQEIALFLPPPQETTFWLPEHCMRTSRLIVSIAILSHVCNSVCYGTRNDGFRMLLDDGYRDGLEVIIGKEAGGGSLEKAWRISGCWDMSMR